MATIYIDNRPYEVTGETNLLDACLSLGFEIPYFCWHPALGSVGACRMCAVKKFRNGDDTRGKIVMSCMEPVADGTRISLEDREVKEFRRGVIEWLMLNHPHDCPVCDEGGECHLQDMTHLSGHVYRRNRFKKRTFRNQDLGPFITHELNRCIQCYRCVRFYRDYAGGRDLDVFGSKDRLYFGRYADGKLESEFSGNLAEVCPTGVFTDKTLAGHYARKWDLQTAPSICVHCSLGCNTIPGERYGILRRISNRFHREVNGYFLCDRGRFGYEFVNSDRRIRRGLIRGLETGTLEPADRETVLDRVALLLQNAGNVVGIGSPRGSLEANFALRTLVGPEHFYAGIGKRELGLLRLARECATRCGAGIASLEDAGNADAAVVLGENVPDTAPLLALALRRSTLVRPRREAEGRKLPGWDATAIGIAVQEQRGPLFILTPAPTRLDDIAGSVLRGAPGMIARIACAAAARIDNRAPAVGELTDDEGRIAQQIADELSGADNPVVVSGTGCGSETLLRAAASLAAALASKKGKAKISIALPECNSAGIALMADQDLDDAFARAGREKIDLLIVVENDLFLRADRARLDAFLAECAEIVVLDSVLHDTAERAGSVLPAASFAGATGTLVNNEGRAQRLYQVFTEPDDPGESWRWLADIGIKAGLRSDVFLRWSGIDEVIASMAGVLPVFAAVVNLAPDADFRLPGGRIPRQTRRWSGRTAIHADCMIHEPAPPTDINAPFSFSMEGSRLQPPAPLVPFFWRPRWNSIQALNFYQLEIGGPLPGGPAGTRLSSVPDNIAPFAFPSPPPQFERQPGRWLVLPGFEVFGSDELSLLAPGIAGIAPGSYLYMRKDECDLLRIPADGKATVLTPAGELTVPVRRCDDIPAGLALLFTGPDRGAAYLLPDWCVIREARS